MAPVAGRASSVNLLWEWRLDTMLRALLIPVRPLARGAGGGDLEVARSLAVSGLLALLCMPALMIVSLAVRAPLAVPVAVAVGYLALAHATVRGHDGRAALLSAVIFISLAGWGAIFVLTGGDARSVEGLAALILAPVIAGLPALARKMLHASADRGPEVVHGAASLDLHGPDAAVLLTDSAGRLVAASQTAAAYLGIGPGMTTRDIADRISRADHPRLFDALAKVTAEKETVAIELHTTGPLPRRMAARIGAGQHGLVEVCLQDLPAAEVTPAATSRQTRCRGEATVSPFPVTPAASDVTDAVTFALQHLEPRAKAEGSTIVVEAEADLVALCDQRLCRRIVHQMLDLVVSRAGRSQIRIVARALPGAVLLRVTTSRCDEIPVSCRDVETDRFSDVRDMVEGAGGTLLVDTGATEQAVSVRLAARPPQVTKQEFVRQVGAA